ncbi:hypothetical protein KEM52_000763 [Ascosphaera acerosa]|nr:hypothetical protein KEM52_000763 [Ascosphaera acerosa]
MAGTDYLTIEKVRNQTARVSKALHPELPEDIRFWSNELANNVDQGIDALARGVKDALDRAAWLPDAIRRSGGRQSPARPPRASGHALVARVYDWCMQHQAWSAAAAAFVLTGAVMVYGTKILHGSRKRKARRAGNGARKEIIIVVGSPHDAMTTMVALDLERRGFIVFVTTSSVTEERLVRYENREDIIPLPIDLSTVRLRRAMSK